MMQQHKESTGGVGTTSDDVKPKKTLYYRHTPQQIDTLEAVFQECPNPDEKKRQQLSKELSLAPQQIKFWFQNRRTQAKVKSERLINRSLKVENDKFRAENAILKEALKNSVCPSCGIQPFLIQPANDEEQKLQMENTQLKEQLCQFLGTDQSPDHELAYLELWHSCIHAVTRDHSSTETRLDHFEQLGLESSIWSSSGGAIGD